MHADCCTGAIPQGLKNSEQGRRLLEGGGVSGISELRQVQGGCVRFIDVMSARGVCVCLQLGLARGCQEH